MHICKKITRAICLLALLSGCSGKQWVHPTADAQQTAGDRAYCLAQAQQAINPNWDPFGMAHSNVYTLCMQGRGWTLQQAQGK